jgi:hypothetical protein
MKVFFQDKSIYIIFTFANSKIEKLLMILSKTTSKSYTERVGVCTGASKLAAY